MKKYALAVSMSALTLARAYAAPSGFSKDAPCPGCNVVLVSFDALQASHVHRLGHAALTTPTIDAMADEGVLFAQAISPAPWTVPATMSWFTGTYPSIHKVVNKFVVQPDKLVLSNLQQLSPGTVTLTEVLKSRGYATAGFTGGAGVTGAFGFKQGFDVYSDDVPPFSGLEVSAPRALKWLSGRPKEKPFFLFLHGYGAHGQYMPPGGYDKRFVEPAYEGFYDGSPAQQRVLRELGLRQGIEMGQDDVRFWSQLYDEKIARADAQFAGFLSALKDMGLSEKTIFVLVSDHGTEKYEHGKFDHGYSLYDELERVLFVVAGPGVKGGRVIQQQVGTIDLLPTILALVGVLPDEKLAAQVKGRSLVPTLRGKPEAGEDVYMETDYRLYTHKRGVRTRDGWKLIFTLDTGKVELYDISHDPSESRDLAAQEPAKTQALKDRLLGHYKSLGIDLNGFSTGCSPVYADQCH